MQRETRWRDAAVRILLATIANEPDPAERKERLLIMREDGLLTDSETADLIAVYGLAAA